MGLSRNPRIAYTNAVKDYYLIAFYDSYGGCNKEYNNKLLIIGIAAIVSGVRA
jgi:hypothetical protein